MNNFACEVRPAFVEGSSRHFTWACDPERHGIVPVELAAFIPFLLMLEKVLINAARGCQRGVRPNDHRDAAKRQALEKALEPGCGQIPRLDKAHPLLLDRASYGSVAGR